MLWHKHHTFQKEPFPYVRQSNIKWRITDAFPNQGDLTKSFPPEQSEAEYYKYEGKTYQSYTVNGAGIYLRHVWGSLVPGFIKPTRKSYSLCNNLGIFSKRTDSRTYTRIPKL